MSEVLVFLQQDKGKLNPGSFSALLSAQELSKIIGCDTFTGICLGKEAQAAVSDLRVKGLNKIILCEDAEFTTYLGVKYAYAVAQIIKDSACKYLIGGSTSVVKDFFPATAGILDCAMISDITQVLTKDSFLRVMYAGNVIAEVKSESLIKVLSVRTTAFSGLKSGGYELAQIESVSIELPKINYPEVVKQDFSFTDRPELTEASIIVSGGRGVQTKEGFEKHIYPLSDVLKAAIGASRAAVDAGFAPNDWQVGQTGKNVAPQLYIAVGISGAVQHLAGMKDSKVVVAINKDPDAPIFEVADYGLVADLNVAVPALIDLIKSEN